MTPTRASCANFNRCIRPRWPVHLRPTVYDYATWQSAHVHFRGHPAARARVQRLYGQALMNITDVGHLTSDADTARTGWKKARGARQIAWETPSCTLKSHQRHAAFEYQEPHVCARHRPHPSKLRSSGALRRRGTPTAHRRHLFDTSKLPDYDTCPPGRRGLEAGRASRWPKSAT